MISGSEAACASVRDTRVTFREVLDDKPLRPGPRQQLLSQPLVPSVVAVLAVPDQFQSHRGRNGAFVEIQPHLVGQFTGHRCRHNGNKVAL